ncbi:unnamed protein product [Spirodela intermedia]|uniref:C2H2-type domain-containing protein n=1 Tax=Spirodela intermedia TaxID=51605 RepID=A0A7I8IQX8_SPIIN|nr:unnamed protein product [Spirodela intermedia]CAA6659552.1 unnamed protein product [Spirodela intermedia]
MRRHVKEFHNEEGSSDGHSQQQHICPEEGCGKAFRYLSKLKKHMDSHVKLDYVDVICCEPGCMKHFTNADCLKAHVRTCHRHVQCPICGTQQLRKNLKRHLRIHESQPAVEKIKCHFPGCLHTFSRKSNLNKHIRAVHLELRPFMCRFAGCGLRFPYRHVRDNHEKSGAHTYVEQFRSRPRGGRKRKEVGSVESLLRKRIAAAPNEISPFRNVTYHHLHRLLSGDGPD